MLAVALQHTALQNLTRDGWLLFITRFARLFAYGALSVVLVLYLKSIRLNESQIGILLTLTLIGDTLVSLWLTTRADRIGRRRVLRIGAALMVAAGLVFASTGNLLLLTVAGIIGVISPSGNEVGPFLPIEQAALSHVVPSRIRTAIFAWYTVSGAFATAIGSLFSGVLAQFLQTGTFGKVGSYRTIVILYAVIGAVLAFLFTRVSSATEIDPPETASAPMRTVLGIGHSHRLVWKLSSLFALDSFAGGHGNPPASVPLRCTALTSSPDPESEKRSDPY